MDIVNIQKIKKTTFRSQTLLQVLLLLIILELILISGCRELLKDKTDEFALNPEIEMQTAFNIYHPHDTFQIEPEETLTIKWQTLKEIEWIDIFLYRKSTQTFTIATRKKNTNEYSWNIPSDLHWSLHYSIKVQNHYNPEEYAFSDAFSIIVR